MARNRMIRVEFWDDEKLSKVSIQARLIFIGLWTFSDDYGVVKGDPRWLKNRIFPYEDSLSIQKFSGWLTELENIFIFKFAENNEKYYYIRNFLKHQKVNRPSANTNPSPPDQIIEHSMSGNGLFSDGSCPKRKEIEIEIENKKKGSCIDLPEWLNKNLWAEFKKYRKEIKAPLTDHAEKLCLAELEKLIQKKYDQQEIINQTIMSGKWKGFYPPSHIPDQEKESLTAWRDEILNGQ